MTTEKQTQCYLQSRRNKQDYAGIYFIFAVFSISPGNHGSHGYHDSHRYLDSHGSHDYHRSTRTTFFLVLFCGHRRGSFHNRRGRGNCCMVGYIYTYTKFQPSGIKIITKKRYYYTLLRNE